MVNDDGVSTSSALPMATATQTQTMYAPDRVHHNHPLYIHPSETQGSVMISTQLQGSEKYSMWSRSMKIVLHGKNKLGFVLGTCKRELYDPSLHELWDRCNAIVLAWIMNTVSQSLMSIVIYAFDAHKVREDLKERAYHMSTGLSPMFPVLQLVEPGPPAVSALLHSSSTSTSDPDASQLSPSSTITDPSPLPVQLRRSSRESRPPVWMGDYVVQQKSSCPYPLSNYVVYDHLNPAYRSSLAVYSAIAEPKTYAEASINPLWVDAMKSEISAPESNNTWTTVDLPPDKFPIDCKWVFKVKYKSTGDVERYKARLVVKGYSQ
ncbi:PREDICTED: uncharacterized protein LOC109219057 [Nicotiana attenuata]|uniref:uncharacterized protein LOC109219057 n=1 Tax=Nicotiana attenuata TaxID=49451 RepID=UPI00090528BC|nr:PREDICTED: uncharacterized protein LOC109219057 [Nicotiana attenuata]